MDLPKNSQLAIIERIRRIIADKADGKQKVLAEMTGIDSGVLSRIRNGHEPVTWGLMIKIEAATGARLNWLAYGAEPVYYPDGKSPEREQSDYFEGTFLENYMRRNNISQTDMKHRMNKSINTIRGYFKTELFSSKVKASILEALGASEEEVFNGLAPMSQSNERIQPIQVDNTNTCQVLRIPVSARAGLGYHAYFSDVPMEREYVTISEDRLAAGIPAERHVVVEVNGDSMQPIMEHGFQMLAYSMPAGSFPALAKIVLVDFRDELTIKRLVNIDYVASTITLRSDKNGAEMRLAMSDIRAIYHVYDYFKAWL